MTNEIDVINKKKAGIYIWHVNAASVKHSQSFGSGL